MRQEPAWLSAHPHENDDLRPFWHAPTLSIVRATIAAEAGGEPTEGMIAVGCVIRTRVMNPAWWGNLNWNEIVLQRAQFSCYWADWGLLKKKLTDALRNPLGFSKEQAAARLVLGSTADPTAIIEWCDDPTGGATHYFNPHKVLPSWAASMKHTVTIGNHAFYIGA